MLSQHKTTRGRSPANRNTIKISTARFKPACNAVNSASAVDNATARCRAETHYNNAKVPREDTRNMWKPEIDNRLRGFDPWSASV